MASDTTANPHAKDPQAFHEKEYEALRREIELDIKETRSLERNALVANAVIFVWLGTTGKEFLNHCWLPWVPVLISGLGAIRSCALLSRMRELGNYIAQLECTFGSLGWERERLKHTSEPTPPTQASTTTPLNSWWRTFKTKPFVTTASIFWIVLILAGILIAATIRPAPGPDKPSTTIEHLSTSGKLDVHVDGQGK